MKFAAEMWNSHNKWDGKVGLMAASVAGNQLQIIDIIGL